MLSVNEAISSLLDNSKRLVDTEEIGLLDAAGRTLANDIVAPIDVPPADNSAMDGYALRYVDWVDSATGIALSQRITAGSVPGALRPGTAARIFTGAELPAGADTVVMQEHCEGSGSEVRILKLPDRGANIRRRGQDISTGQKVLSAGQRLRPQDQGLAASLGIASIAVYRRLKVAVLSTGDELIEPGQAAQPGQIYNSNRYMMQARAAGQADVIVTSGGVSVGEEDHVKDVVESLGAIDLWRIAIKPGKPFAFGQVRGTPFIGLPGNPVSVLVTMLVVGRPYLFACQGISATAPKAVRHSALFSRKGSMREDYLRVRATGDGLELFPNLSSGVLFSTTWGDGLVCQRVDTDIREGDFVEYLPWSSFS